MIEFFTAGESHGRGIFALIDGLPAGLTVKREYIDADLSRRQMGYGRGGRMQIEKDRVDVLSGIRGGETLGSPVLLAVWNADFANWQQLMDPWQIEEGRELFTPRPGHADLAGAARFRHQDLRNILERSSARETAGRVAAGGLFRALLAELGIRAYSWVSAIGNVRSDAAYDAALCDKSSVFCPDAAKTAAMEALIDRAQQEGDTLGGEFRVVLEGLPAGIGSCTQWNRRLDTLVSAHMMSIPGIKAVQIGIGTAAGTEPGSGVHDEIHPGHPPLRKTNNAGGLEGGISNGEALVVTCTMKPIPTLKKGLATIDIRDGQAHRAEYERSDCCAVPAASVVGEAMLMIAVSSMIIDDFAAPNMEMLRENFERQRNYWSSL